MHNIKKPTKLITYLGLLSFLFFVIQVSAYFTATKDAGFIFHMIRKHIQEVPVSLLLPELKFLLAQFLLYFVFTLVVWLLTRLTAYFFAMNWRNTCFLGFGVWLCSALTVVFLNQMYFPASNFGRVMATFFSPLVTKVTTNILLVILGFVTLMALLGLIKMIWQKMRIWGVLLSSILVFGGFVFGFHSPAVAKATRQQDLPNVIFIGVDSLRPDYTAINADNSQSFSPNLDQFLKTATVFTDAITPLARTYPSWVSILTGQYPKQVGIRFNLEDQSNLSLTNTLPQLLQKAGYATYYATDERRFSNISQRFGFDYLLGPGQGVNDFVLGTINDLPLSNLVVNTPIGHRLFPYNSGNRAAFYSYKTNTFNAEVERALLQQSHRPIFLAIHFCLPHWPYVWSSQVYDKKLFPDGLYKLSVKEADRQAGEFIQFLKKNHFLDHAIVVVLSDHGEAVLRTDDRLVSRPKYIRGPKSSKTIFQDLDVLLGYQGYHFSRSYGHGSDILSFVQYHTVLAMRTFGLSKNNVAEKINVPVSEIDIKPTVLSLLNLSVPKTSGVSLLPYLKGEKIALKNRVLFSETGFNPIAIKQDQVDIKKTVLQGINAFQVNPSASFVMKKDMEKQLLLTKQRAVLYQNWILAIYPKTKTTMQPVLVNKATGQWTDDLSTPFAKQAPLSILVPALKKFYGKELVGFSTISSSSVTPAFSITPDFSVTPAKAGVHPNEA